MKSNKLIFILLGVLVLVIIIGVVGKKRNWFGGSAEMEVAVEKVAKRSIVETVTASGKINPHTEVKLSSEVSGEIIELNVKDGDSVKKGQLLCVINPSIYEAMVNQSAAGLNQMKANLASSKASLIQAKVALDQAKKTFDRNKVLYDAKVISDADFEASKLSLDQSNANYETSQEQVNAGNFTVASSEAQLKQAEDNLIKTKIHAPMGGIVSLVNVKLGERVVGTAQMAGTEIMRVADLNNMQAEVDVNENDVLRISIGDTADIEVDAYVNKKFKGVVSEISYSSTTALQQAAVSTSQATNFTVKIKLLKESYSDLIKPEIGKLFPFRPGMSTTADIKTESRTNVLTVPIQSVTTREQKDLGGKDTSKIKSAEKPQNGTDLNEIVFVVENGKAVAKKVKTGIQDANYIEIISGLNEGEQVIKAPFKFISKTLHNGDAVKIVDEKNLFKDQKEE